MSRRLVQGDRSRDGEGKEGCLGWRVAGRPDEVVRGSSMCRPSLGRRVSGYMRAQGP